MASPSYATEILISAWIVGMFSVLGVDVTMSSIQIFLAKTWICLSRFTVQYRSRQLGPSWLPKRALFTEQSPSVLGDLGVYCTYIQ